MSINIIETEDPTSDYLFCDLCRSKEHSNRCCKFKQYNGWYCLNCFELCDEDAEENDENIIIVMRALKIFIEISSPVLRKNYYQMKLICKEINSTK